MLKKFLGEPDGALIRAMRHRAAYSGYKNSLIEWSMSEAWANPGKEPELYSKALIRLRASIKGRPSYNHETKVFSGELENKDMGRKDYEREDTEEIEGVA
jgi:hypothetical protein